MEGSPLKTPKAPDPVATAAAQSGTNRDTAIASGLLSMTNQVTPDGSLTYNQTGTNSYVDSLTGKTVTLPSYTATQTLSAGQQAIKDQSDKASLGLGELANQQIASLQGALSKPFSFNNDDASNWAYDLASQRILPQQQQNQEALRAQLTAQGIRPGSAAYNSEMARLTNANTDQLNQLALSGRGQAFQEAFTEYNSPVNTISALTSGAQVQNPEFINTPQAQVGGVDYTGLVQDQYKAKVANQQATMGGLFGLGAGLIKALPFSDRRLKKDIVPMGSKKGLPWYGFHYLWETDSEPLNYGFMADEAMQVYPHFVRRDPSGYYRVDRDMILEAS